MALKWNGNALILTVQQVTAEGLLRGAVFLQAEQRQRMNRSNPGPKYLESSRPGEYLRARTGNARDSVTFEPTSVREVIRKGLVRVGYRAQGWYGALWERRDRRGLADTAGDLVARLLAVITGAGRQ